MNEKKKELKPWQKTIIKEVVKYCKSLDIKDENGIKTDDQSAMREYINKIREYEEADMREFETR